MVSSSEKRRLIESYREPPDARAVIARSAAGLLVLVVVAVVGSVYTDAETAPAGVTASRAASGR